MKKKGNEGAFKLIGAQLDLARQPETLDHIMEFVDLIAKEGYNCLTLYLEGRIRTKTFPYMDKSESYTPDDMRRIVDHAAARKIDVLPVVSTLGHAEHFLERPELERLAELRGGRKGKFSTRREVFCPSLEETYEFLEEYLREITPLFPFEYFHAGCDEAWDIGMCELCRGREHADIFADHLRRSHELVTGKLGKRMIIWDDLFECYPGALENLPRDIVMCTWQYEKLVGTPLGHFGDRPRMDKFSIYDRMGFDYILAPAVLSLRNIRTITEYARGHRPMGALLTMWELKRAFPFGARPMTVCAGRLWSGADGGADARGAEEAAIRDTSGVDDPLALAAVRAVLNMGVMRRMPSGRSDYLHGVLAEDEHDKLCAVEAAITALEPRAGTGDVVDDLLLALRVERLYFELRTAAAELLRPLSADERAKAVSVFRERARGVVGLKSAAAAMWRRCRKGFEVHTDEFYDSVGRMLDSLAGELGKAGGFLELFLFLPNFHGVPKTAIGIKYEGSDKWEEVASGVFKQLPSEEPFYSFKFPVSPDRAPVAVSIVESGYGGQGVTFVEVVSGAGRFVPVGISLVSGSVQNPGNVLLEDRKWCWIGEPDTGRVYLSPRIAEDEHRMEILLGRKD